MKSYVTSGTGSQQTLTGSQDEKVAIYQTLADAEADLANLEAGQIVATPDTGDENAQPVDVIQAGNMHAVTSNAVATSNAMPVDEVTLNNVHSVTSNAVAQALVNGSEWQSIGYSLGTEFMYKVVGKTVFIHIGTGAVGFPSSGADMVLVSNSETIYLPSSIRPSRLTQFALFDNVHDTVFHARIYQNGTIRTWGNQIEVPQDINSWQADFCYRLD